MSEMVLKCKCPSRSEGYCSSKFHGDEDCPPLTRRRCAGCCYIEIVKEGEEEMKDKEKSEEEREKENSYKQVDDEEFLEAYSKGWSSN